MQLDVWIECGTWFLPLKATGNGRSFAATFRIYQQLYMAANK